MKMKNSGWRSIRIDARTSSPTKNTSSRSAVVDVAAAAGGCSRRRATPRPPPRCARVVACQAGSGSPGDDAEERSRSASRRYPPQSSMASPNRSQARLRRRRSWPNATRTPSGVGNDASTDASLPPEQPDGDGPTTSVTIAMPEQRQRAAAAVPSQASWRPWTPGGVKSPIRIEDLGQVHPRQVDPAEEHHDEEHRDRDGRRHAGRRRDRREQQPDREQRRHARAGTRRGSRAGGAGSGTPNATWATTTSRTRAMTAVTQVDDELRGQQPERVGRRRREPPQDALLAVGREADRQRLDAERPDRDDDERRHEHVDEAQAAERRDPARCGPNIEPKISRMTVGRAMAASHVIGSRNSSFASVTMRARISFMTAPWRCGPPGGR